MIEYLKILSHLHIIYLRLYHWYKLCINVNINKTNFVKILFATQFNDFRNLLSVLSCSEKTVVEIEKLSTKTN